MISAGKLTPGHAKYFEGEVAKGREDYYAGRGESPGEWKGRGADAAGLSGEVRDGELAALFEMAHPVTGEALGASYNVSATYVDRFGNEQIRHKRAAFDATFSVPKSVSELIAQTDGERQAVMLDAIAAGNDAAMNYLDTHAAFSRMGKGGVRQVDTEGLIIGTYMHRTSRAGDPQFHFHNLISNRVQCEDGQYRALDGKNLFPELKTAGMVGQAAMRAELGRLGVEFGAVSEHGQADIVGVPEDLMTLHSKRTKQVEAHANAAIVKAEEALQRTLTPAERAEKFDAAAVATRVVKSRELHADEGLYERWRTEAVDAGHDPDLWVDNVFDRTPAQQLSQHPQLTDAQIVDSVVDALTKSHPTWGRTEATREVARTVSFHDTTAEAITDRIETLSDQVLASERVVALTVETPQPQEHAGNGRVRRDGLSPYVRHNSSRFTTVTAFAREQGILDHVDQGREARIGIATPTAVEDAIGQRAQDGQPLSPDQEAAVRRVTQSGEAFVAVVGPAGAGKSKTLEAVNDAYERSNIPVRGLAPSAKAAGVLREEAGITNSDTLAKLLHENARDGGPLPEFQLQRGEVIVLDEASMANTADLHALVGLAKTADAKIVTVGDYRQLGAVDAGGMFRLIVADSKANDTSAAGPAELDQIWRFSNEWERSASLQLRDGDTAAIAVYDQHDRVSGGTREEMLDHAFNTWAHHRTETGESIVVTATDRNTVTEFNTRARNHLQESGQVAPDSIQAGNIQAAVGDEILTLRNDRRLVATDGTHVRNGDRWTIQNHTPDGGLLVGRLDADTPGQVTLPASYLDAGHIDHAYATTVHKAQGVTVDHAITIVDQNTTNQSLYVGGTRGRDSNEFLAVTEAEITEYEIETGPTPTANQILETAIGRDATEKTATEYWRTQLDQPQLFDTPPTPELKEPAPPQLPERPTVQQSPTVETETPGQSAPGEPAPEVVSPRLTTEQLQGHAKQLADAQHEVASAKAGLQSLAVADNSDQRDIRRLEGLRDADQTSIDRNTNNIESHESGRVWKPSERSNRRAYIADAQQQIADRTAAIEEKTAQIDVIEQRRETRRTGFGGFDVAQGRLHRAEQRFEKLEQQIQPDLANDRMDRIDELTRTGMPPRITDRIGQAPTNPDHHEQWETAASLIEQHHATWPNGTPPPGDPNRSAHRHQQAEVGTHVDGYNKVIDRLTPGRGIERDDRGQDLGR